MLLLLLLCVLIPRYYRKKAVKLEGSTRRSTQTDNLKLKVKEGNGPRKGREEGP